MKVRDLMSRQVTTVTAEEELSSALQIMLWSGIRHLPVIKDEQVIGVLTHRDILAQRGGNGSGWRLVGTVADGMVSPAETTSPDEDLEDAAARMSVSKLGCLPVIESGQLVGILTTSDLVAHLAQQTVEPPATPHTVADVMTKTPLSTTPDTRLTEAASMMFDRGVRHLPVLDANGGVMGMLSDRDVRSAYGNPLLGGLRGHMSVDDAMSRSIGTVQETDTIEAVTRLLVDERVGAVAVVNADDALSGVVSYLDLLRQS